MIPAIDNIFMLLLSEEDELNQEEIRIPSNLKVVEPLRITLLSYELPVSYRVRLKSCMSDIENIKVPQLQLAEPHIVRDNSRVCLVADCKNQIEIWNYVLNCVLEFGLSQKIMDTERDYHVTLANLTGNYRDSISKPWMYEAILLDDYKGES